MLNFKKVAITLILQFAALYGVSQNVDTGKIEKISFHAQATIIDQYKPSFKAKYSGANSLTTTEESQSTITSTLYAGTRLWKNATVYLNPEISGGSGLSSTLGVAASTNGESFRVGSTEPKIYLARLFLQQLFPLSKEKKYAEADLNQLAGYIPEKYIGVSFGKIALSDYFDNNNYSHDPRTQFMSWGLMGNGAWDYPANTRGYTDALVVEYVTPKNELRYSLALVPTQANGNTLDYKIGKANSSTLEYTKNYSLNSKAGVVRVLIYYTIARMGNYDESIALSPVDPDITATRKYSRSKYGFGINAEQALSKNTGVFFKTSWNDGNNEIWAFTEIDRTASAGIVTKGANWKRADDQVGLACVISGLSTPHKNYLKAGGKGFLLGDGALNYGPEQLAELYYSAALIKKSLFLSGAYQFILHPGYNKDRGPVHVFSVRVHLEM
jgi:high affinity Mn2+ porin